MKDAIRATVELAGLISALLLIGVGLNVLAEIHPNAPKWIAIGAFIVALWWALYSSIKYRRENWWRD